MRILIIEDEILIQQSLKKLIEKRGFLVDVTERGHEAISKIEKNDYYRIVCDLMLKDISGFDVIEESKKKYTNEQISKKFIIMTAYSSEQVLQKARKYNCRVLHKPFENLVEAINVFTQDES
ncbi:MAG: response regulator [Bacteriovoracaceae bacterium]|jgi:DNA-binding response OmpR family regulator|nr:hypothetical protein [Halobacteriovoraceae bacterium]MDP7321265.1 response regulator [Bacteriovoracaceae bacterium]